MKILILRFSSIGDIVLTTPVIRALKQNLADCELHFATKSLNSPLLEANPYIDKLQILENSLMNLIKNLRKEKFDLVVDLHNNLRTALIKSALQKKAVSYKKLNLRKWFFVRSKINTLPNTHIVDRYMKSLKSLDITTDSSGLDYFIPEKDEVEMSWLPESHQKSYVAVVIGGKHATKKLPVLKLIELCDKINRPIILLGGPEETAIAEEVKDFFNHEVTGADEQFLNKELLKRTKVFNGCGKFNINQSASILKQATYVFSNDTGLMHIAAAFRKEIFSIWGNTVPEFGMYPYRTKFTIFENKGLYCRPCSKLGFNQCPKGHFRCMNELKFDFYLPE